MKNTFLLLIGFLLLFGCANKTTEAKNNTSSNNMNETLRHIVLFKFKASSEAVDIQKIEDAFIALPTKIKEIKDFEWGLNNSTEGLDKGFTHCFFVTFESEADRAAYLPHPDHLAFVALLDGHVEDVLVLDYWSK
jgi:hypothetical protein